MPKFHAIPEADLATIREFLLDLPHRMFLNGQGGNKIGRIVDRVGQLVVQLSPEMEHAVLVHMGHVTPAPPVQPEPESKYPNPDPAE